MAKILVIDDKPDNLLTIEALLHHLKPEYNVLKALSGTEGIKIAQKQQPDTPSLQTGFLNAQDIMPPPGPGGRPG